MSTTFSTGLGVIKIFTNEVKALYVGLTGGLSVIIAFLPEIINFAKALFNGKDAVNAMALNFKNLNDVMKDSNKEASSEITRLQFLYRSATDINNSYGDRIKSVQELKREFPDHLKNLSDEDILNGKAKKNYEELSKAIFENARARAALSKIENLAAQQLDIDFLKQKIINVKNAEYKKIEPEKVTTRSEMGERVTEMLTPQAQQKSLKDQQQTNRDLLRDELKGQDLRKRLLQNQIDFLISFAGGNNKIAQAINNTQTTPIITPTKKKPKPAPKPHILRSEDLIAAQSITIAQHFENEKKAYDSELALLNDQLNKKLISQADYNNQSQGLQDKYHQGISSSVKDFAEKSMPNTMQHFKSIAEANRLQNEINKDEKNIEKAILPWQQFDAEKKLIQDKYAYEITQAEGNEEKIKELKEKSQQAQTDLTQKYEQQRREFALNTAQQVADKAFSIIGNNIKAGSDAKIKGFEKDKANELSNKSLTETQRKAIEDKYQKKENQEKVKAFKAEQRMSVLQAVVNGALAVTKATAQSGILAPFVIPGIIASTALQIATIVAQKPPAFAKGGRFVSDGRGALLPGYSRTDNTNAYLRSGEAVVVSEAMRNPWARNLVSAINVAHGGRDFSMPNTGSGYAIGGIFTDGGNANRYYNQPVNDIKDMANTLAYQMMNNFPPIYVDVKDVNNQQNILAQTVNRVNL
ncbi:hypothetical protein [Mucilaginibacter phyllosphaerae]|uniref:Phage tail tape measure protein n=1 Tax=Mucilaginibacter phyllosphaerae TaxID=1812349 RepID=A0A4Y8AJL6_9SPHI|nr:hypothetical protein [Mucilaginibacter phyllosphaerae]MBB3967731.1 hypothetical protein [Mucilaginibacter phyllosphaerae]TEW69216.1 hypothetical protein E2R65_03345 [Mucilaginibacter phyllosphaerae]